MSNQKVGLKEPFPSEPSTDHCKDCHELIEIDEYLAHNGFCHRCNPKKIKNIDAALERMEPLYYRQRAKDILRRIIKEDRPMTIEDLRDHFWFHLANDKELSHKSKNFMDVVDFAIQDLMEAGIFEENAA